MRVPTGTDTSTLVSRLGDVWTSFGWKVVEKDSAPRPNRYATTPDGYGINVVRGYPNADSPTLAATSPCFDGNLINRDLGAPVVIESTGEQG
ncbi:hypothetical protein [Gordonia jinhuaensis]|nr:hypothetical protein [Gordonia jinhuaensis]